MSSSMESLHRSSTASRPITTATNPGASSLPLILLQACRLREERTDEIVSDTISVTNSTLKSNCVTTEILLERSDQPEHCYRLFAASGSSGSRALMLACWGPRCSPHSLWAAAAQFGPVIYLGSDPLKDCYHTGEWWFGIHMVKIKLITQTI
ncbi:hypothetical protein Q5P01_006139 [Channa striata]|uniref:Uncharacterized protein n=1 Tax=Channa striata TaxID=64152 RepID=A0AA88NGW2_CHASR|nr:hypothetical protein Q5P01_006139 [Channa striata]